MADEMDIPVMPGDRKREEPEETHVIFKGRKMTKEQALEQLGTLVKRKEKQKYASPDPEKRTQAGVSQEAAENVRSQLSPRNEAKLAKEPFDADAAFNEKVVELRAKVEGLRNE